MPYSAMSSVAMTQSTVAMMEAHEAEERSCKAFNSTFHAETATVEQQREYAHCVGMLHPSPLTPGGLVAVKCLLALGFIGFAIGARMGWKESYGSEFVDAFVYGLGGFLVLPLATGLVGSLIAALLWLLGIL